MSEGLGHPRLTGLYRYPIKGLSPQALDAFAFETGQPMALDRVFALVRPGTPFDLEHPRWAKKGMFIMLMLEAALARVQTVLDVATMRLSVSAQGAPVFAADLTDAAGRHATERFFGDLVPTLKEPPRFVRSPSGHFMDKPDAVISLINLATIRSLEAQWGYAIDPMRFRANLYIDGVPPWQEFAWIGQDIVIGAATFRVDRRNGRCGATNVDPATGDRDLDIPGALRASFGHKDLGVYLVVKTDGMVTVGDSVTVPEAAAPVLGEASAPVSGRRHICRGCYFIYAEDDGLAPAGIPAGTPFADIAADWRCPDCGTDKAAFEPHGAAPPIP